MLLPTQKLLHAPSYLIQLDASHALAVLLLENAVVRLIVRAHVCAHQVLQLISACNTLTLFTAFTLAIAYVFIYKVCLSSLQLLLPVPMPGFGVCE